MKSDTKSTIEAGKAILGIEFGSTRIKAVLIDQENKPIAQINLIISIDSTIMVNINILYITSLYHLIRFHDICSF